MCEVYKTLINLNPIFMKELLKPKPLKVSLRAQRLLAPPSARTRCITVWSSLNPQVINAKNFPRIKN